MFYGIKHLVIADILSYFLTGVVKTLSNYINLQTNTNNNKRIKLKKNILLLLFTVSFFIINDSIQAQDDSPHIFTVTTFQATIPQGGSMAEFDSLQQVYTDNVTMKNKYVISQRCVRHLYGSDSRQLIYITEYKNMEDMLASSEEDGKLFRAAWSDKEKRAEYNKANRKYFGHHSDEIYTEVASGKK